MKSKFFGRTRSKQRISRRAKMETLELRQLLAVDGVSLVGDSISVQQNSNAITIDVLSNDLFDNDYLGDRKITGLSTGSLGGRIEVADDGGAVRYTPPADVNGVERFRYTVDHQQSAEVVVDISSPLPEFRTSVFLFRDEYRFDVLAQADFPDDYSGERRITLISDTDNGADVRISDDGMAVIYRSRIGVEGTDRFNYIVDDRFFGTAIIDVVNPIEHDRYEVLQDSGLTRLQVLDNDFIDGADASIDLADVKRDAQITHVISDSENVDVMISDDGRSIDFRTLASRPDHFGYETFRYVVDGRFETTVSVSVQRPVRNDYFVADINGGEHSFDVLSNDVYRSIFGSTVRVVDRVTSVSQGDQGGIVEIDASGRGLVYTPAEGFVGTESFRYQADGQYWATVNVSVSSPVRDDHAVAYIGANNRFDVLDNDFASSVTGASAITAVGDSMIGASIAIGPDGRIVYTPPEDALGRVSPVYSDSFDYVVNDSLTATVRVRLARITSGDSYRVDRPVTQTLDVLANDHFSADYPGLGIITSVSSPSAGGVVSITTDGRALLYQPGDDRETFTYTVDGRFTETVQVHPIQRLVSDRAVADQNGGGVEIDVLANDFVDQSYINRRYGEYLGDRILTSVSNSESGAIVTMTEDGQARYTPAPDFVGQDSFTYTVDGFLTSTVYVDVIRRVNDDVVHVAPDSTETLNLLANDILGADYDGPGLITNVSSSAAEATIRISDDGRSVSYTAPDGFLGHDSFVYTLDDQSKAAVTVVVGSSPGDQSGQFESMQQFREYLIDTSIERFKHQFGQPGYGYDPRYLGGVFETADVAGNTTSYSETNVQVAGVDEDDIVETDGDFIYSLQGDELAIVRRLPDDELQLVSRTQIEGTPTGMYLNEGRVTIISRLWSHAEPIEANGFVDDEALRFDSPYPYPFPRDVTTILTVLDVTDRESPTVVQRTTLDGDYSETRRIGDQVFVVLNSSEMLLRPHLVGGEDDSPGVYETEQQFVDRVTRDFATLLDDLLPAYSSFNAGGEWVRGGPIVVPEDIYRSSSDETAMTVVVSLNMASNEPGLSSASGVMSTPSGSIYATAEHLYVFSSPHSFVGSHQSDESSSTNILKFDWDGQSGSINFTASGIVPGVLLNQFSADEHDGNLRVVTEVSNTYTGNFSGRDETTLFVLQDDSGTLEYVGSLQNLAVGHDVKSVRFFGDRVFVTTFETVDPLYAIDLSDPTDPFVAGHVSIPGYNSYMQFIAEDRLLTVGVNSASGRGGRATVSLFDVGDLTSPQLIDRHRLASFSTSEANLDHHAFSWFSGYEVLAIPVSRHFQDRFDDDDDGYREAIRRVQEDSLSMLHVSADGITLRGEIDHEAKVRRSVRINDHVYSIGDDAVRSTSLADPGVIVGEARFDDDDVSVVSVAPRVIGSGFESVEAARNDFASNHGKNAGDVMVVTHENREGAVDVILRSGEQHYRYQKDASESAEWLESSFGFVEGWHNDRNGLDVNGDQTVTPADALVIINELSRGTNLDHPVDHALRQIDVDAKLIDANDDGRLTPLDALMVINELHRRSISSGTHAPEGEMHGAETVLPIAIAGQAEMDRHEDEYPDEGRLF